MTVQCQAKTRKGSKLEVAGISSLAPSYTLDNVAAVLQFVDSNMLTPFPMSSCSNLRLFLLHRARDASKAPILLDFNAASDTAMVFKPRPTEKCPSPV